MTTSNIAIIGGVILLLLLLVKLRRDKKAAGAGRTAAPGRSREPRRRRGRGSAPPAPSEPMPLAAAAGTRAPAPADDGWPLGPLAEGPSTTHGEPQTRAPAWDEQSAPAEWPPAADPQDDPVADAADSGRADREPAPPAAGWPEDELVTAPGWPMPGEVDMSWTPPAPAGAVSGVAQPSATPVGAWSEQAATSAPSPGLEWKSDDAPAGEEIPHWSPSPEPDAMPAWDPQTPSPGEVAALPAEEAPPVAQAPGEAAVEALEVPVDAADPLDPYAPGQISWESGAPEAGQAVPVGGTESMAWEADAPPGEPEAVAWEPPDASYEAVEPVAEAAAYEPEAMVAWEPEPVAPAPALVLPPAPGSPEPTAWWDEEPEAPVAVAVDPARTGRFALGGLALQPGQQTLSGVSFRAALTDAPRAWSVGASPGAGPGTIELVLDGAINCGADGLEVVMEPGFAPTTEGFTVRVAAAAAGPFAASGTFRVR